jgi:uncharacterized membrane protein YgcG
MGTGLLPPPPSSAPAISTGDAAIHTIRGNLGPGCLALPFAFAQCARWQFGVITLVVTVAQGVYCMQVLAECERAAWADRCQQLVAGEDGEPASAGEKDHGCGGSSSRSGSGSGGSSRRRPRPPPARLSLGETVQSGLGPSARYVVDLFVLVFQAGVCCVYISLVAENVSALPHWPLKRSGTILALGPVFALLGQVNVISKAALSHFGNAIMAVVVLSATAAAVAVMVAGERHPSSASASGSRGDSTSSSAKLEWMAAVNLAATTFYAFEGIGLVLPVANAMADPSSFATSVRIAATVLALCYGVVGVSCGEAFRHWDLGSGSITAFLAERAHDIPPLTHFGLALQILNVLGVHSNPPAVCSLPAPVPRVFCPGVSSLVCVCVCVRRAHAGRGGVVACAVLSTFALQMLPAAEVVRTWCGGAGRGEAGAATRPHQPTGETARLISGGASCLPAPHPIYYVD